MRPTLRLLVVATVALVAPLAATAPAHAECAKVLFIPFC
jgi:hypothetical protein